MDDERTTIEAVYQDNDIIVRSTDPLTGVLEFTAETDEVVQVALNRESAEALLSALVQFLAAGDGIDAPVYHSVQ